MKEDPRPYGERIAALLVPVVHCSSATRHEQEELYVFFFYKISESMFANKSGQ